MPELPVKEIRRSELHLPEIKREDIIRSLSEIRLPSVELPARLTGREPSATSAAGRFDWRSIDIGEALAGAAAGATAITRIGRPLLRRPRVTLAAGAVLVVGLVTVAVLANPAVRERAGKTVRRVRDRAGSRMAPSDVLEVDDDVAAMIEDAGDDLASAGNLPTDGTLPAPESPAIDGPMDDAPSRKPVEAFASAAADEPGEAARPA